MHIRSTHPLALALAASGLLTACGGSDSPAGSQAPRMQLSISATEDFAGLDAGHAFADLDDDARAFMAEHGGEDAFRVVARQRERIGVADAGVGDLDQDLALLRGGHVDLDDLQGFSSLEGDGGFGFHGRVFLSGWLRNGSARAPRSLECQRPGTHRSGC